MIRKTAQRRTNEFTSKSVVANFFGKDYILSNEINHELLDFWTKWLDDNPKREPSGPVYSRLCNFIVFTPENRDLFRVAVVHRFRSIIRRISREISNRLQRP